jgi:plasmid maintenance system antidote protein VapI
MDKSTIGANNYVEHSMSILERIHELLDEKFEGKQSELAKKLGKKESEISKWLNGVQNFTLFTISKLEEVFEDSIITVSSKENKTCSN